MTAKPGYSAELISTRVDPAYYDDLMKAIPITSENDTLLKCFKSWAHNTPNNQFLGTRRLLDTKTEKGEPMFGDYEWKSYGEVEQIAQNLAKGIVTLGLAPAVRGEDRDWHFMGVWAKNCW